VKISKKGIKETTENIKQKEHEKKLVEKKVEKLTEKHKECNETLLSLQGQLLGIDLGGEQKEKGTLANQLMEAQRLAGEAESETKQAGVKKRHLEATLSEKKKRTKKS